MNKMYFDANDNIRVGDIEIFLEIAVDSYFEATECLKKIKELQADELGNIDHLFFLTRKKYKHEIQGLISLCTFMEAIIIEIAVVELGSTFYKENLDSLSIMAKWRITPKMAYGKEHEASRVYFENLNKLIKTRNFLTHYRTKIADHSGVVQQEDLFIVLKKSLDTLEEMLSDLSSMDSTESLYLHFQEQLARLKDPDMV